MHAVIDDRVLPAVLFFSLLLPVGSAAETLRDRTNRYFNGLDWTSGNKMQAKEITGKNLPGGNETFPVLGKIPQKTSSIIKGSLYPREVRLGSIDYGNADPRVVSLLRSVSVNLENSGLDADFCDPSRPFLPVIASFQLAKLPKVTSVLFSNPVEKGENVQTTQYRLQFLKDSASVYVYLHVTASLVGEAWKITEFLFDGETYAGLAQSY